MDIYSRKIVGWRVHDCESMEHSSQLEEEIYLRKGVLKDQVVLHSDNGGAMKRATMLATLQRLGTVPSFRRPRVSDDNPYSESLFKRLRYCSQYPSKPFTSTDDANGWVRIFFGIMKFIFILELNLLLRLAVMPGKIWIF